VSDSSAITQAIAARASEIVESGQLALSNHSAGDLADEHGGLASHSASYANNGNVVVGLRVVEFNVGGEIWYAPASTSPGTPK
jgi:hypothetical protein